MWTSDSFGPQPVDIARDAISVTASRSHPDDQPTALIDGNPGTLWIADPQAGEKPWAEICWETPQTMRQIVVYSNRRNLTHIILQAWINDKWLELDQAGAGQEPLTYATMFRFAPLVTDKIRICDLEGRVALEAVSVHAQTTPAVVRMGADLLGGLTGIVCESMGILALADAKVRINADSKTGPWQVETRTDKRGMFFAEIPTGLYGPVKVVAETAEDTAEWSVDAADLHTALTPQPQCGEVISLTGIWRFAIEPPENFWQPNFDDNEWNDISVPAHWEFEGFRSPSGIGGYRRHIAIPAAWRGQRIKIAFDGVYSGATVWVNGARVGAHEGGATPFVLDITEAVRFGSENLLALRVEEFTAAQTLDKMSMYADFHLAGIYRAARIFPVPAAHICRFHAEPMLDDAYKDGTLRVQLSLVNEAAREKKVRVKLDLRDPQDKPVRLATNKLEFILAGWQRSNQTVEIPVKAPQHWEAEHPRLYTLTAIVQEGSKEIERVARKIGFRKVEIRGKEFFVNGVKAKLGGSCHHDSHPLLGRAVTPELTRQDLEMMKAANLNALRTSHYPPIPELLDIADEIGFFVEDEGPFCWSHNSVNALLTPLVLQHQAELLERDRSHPSVLWWSTANESRWGIALDNAYQWLRRQETTRYFSAATSNNIDIATLHNPTSLVRMRKAEESPVPMIFDESMCVWQGIWGDAEELWVDPGLRDYWVVPHPEVWECFLTSKTNFGHMIWCWADDIFCLPGYGLEFAHVGRPVQYLNEIYKLPGRGMTGDAPWGLVDGWRRPKPEWWLCKKVHTPVRIDENKPLEFPVPGEPIRVPVRNTYFYTDLSELRITWALGDEEGIVNASAPPQTAADLEIRPMRNFAPGDKLELRIRNSQSGLVDICRLSVGQAPEQPAAIAVAHSEIRVREDDRLSGPEISFINLEMEMAFHTTSGELKRAIAASAPVLCDAPILHCLSMTDNYHILPDRRTWKKTDFAWEKAGNAIKVRTSGTYTHFSGYFDYLIQPDGEVQIDYHFTYDGPEFKAKELGLKLSLPVDCQHLSWQRQAEFSVYPDDHIGRPVGDCRAFPDHGKVLPPSWSWAEDISPMGCNDFRSTKRHILQAVLTDAIGAGIKVISDGSQHLRATMETDRAALFVNNWYGGTMAIAWGEWTGNYGEGKVMKAGDVLAGRVKLKLWSA
jgi:beta-galactosidase